MNGRVRWTRGAAEAGVLIVVLILALGACGGSDGRAAVPRAESRAGSDDCPRPAPGDLYRGSGGATYVFLAGALHQIPDDATFAARGYDAARIRQVEDECLRFMPAGDALAAATPAPAQPPGAARTLPLRGRGKVYFVPVGEFAPADLESLVTHFNQRFSLAVETLPGMALDPSLVDARRRQAVVEDLIEAMKRRYAALAEGPDAILIGFTTQDIYPRTIPGFQWEFGHRMSGRFAIISTARMDPAFFRLPPDGELRRVRLRKMATRYVGFLYYGLAPSADARSVLYGDLFGIEDLDAMSEDF